MSSRQIIDLFLNKVETEGSYQFERIKKACDFSVERHFGQKRLSGEDYIIHPVNVASILLDLKMDSDTICAALLHDILEDTDTTEGEIKDLFSPQVLKLIKGVTKISTIKSSSKFVKETENLRTFIFSVIDDVRVLFIKLADRLHNIQTLQYQPKAKQIQIARNTLEIYAPLASRLGIEWLKNELEDGSLYFLEPKAYSHIKHEISMKKQERENLVRNIIENTKSILIDSGIHNFEISGRAKHFFSIYKKMREQSKTFEEIFDLIGIRILTDSVKDCYLILGLIHNNFKPISGRFKDYIALPKSNLYQSLHTTVIDNEKRKLEIQIRTHEMDHTAEFGIAAHWIYKEDMDDVSKIQNELKIFSKLRSWDKSDFNDLNLVENLKSDIFQEDIFVFTPKGDVVELPRGATVLDFAFAIHTEVGLTAIGAKVNGKLVPLRRSLKNTDLVEIITSEKKIPSNDWLGYVKTRKAKNKLRSYFKKITNLNKTNKITLSPTSMEKISQEMEKSPGFKSPDSHSQSKKGKNIKETHASDLHEHVPGTGFQPDGQPGKKHPYQIFINNEKNISYEFAQCCQPQPGDAIRGVVSIRKKTIVIHKVSCEHLKGIKDKNKIFLVDWSDPFKFYSSKYKIVGKGNATGVITEIISSIDKVNLILDHMNFHTKPGDKVICYFIVKSKTQENLKMLEELLCNCNGIISHQKVN